MKLLRYGPVGKEKPGLLDAKGNIRSLVDVIEDVNGKILSKEGLDRLSNLDIEKLPLIESTERIAPCVGQIGKFICIGLNYRDHAQETGAAIPSEPVVFLKANSAISGPYDNVIIPRGSKKTDWEVELGVVIGTAAKYVSKENALKHVAGYCIINDISEREYQLSGTGGQWAKGKSCDTFAPIGPWLVTADEVRDPQGLELWLEVDGHRYQQGNTKNMIYDVAHLVSYLSHISLIRE